MKGVGTARQAAWPRYGSVAPVPPSKDDLRSWLDDDHAVVHPGALRVLWPEATAR